MTGELFNRIGSKKLRNMSNLMSQPQRLMDKIPFKGDCTAILAAEE
jgi:hypothetical protein